MCSFVIVIIFVYIKFMIILDQYRDFVIPYERQLSLLEMVLSCFRKD